MSVAGLLERERELADLVELLDTREAIAIVEGPAGIGKSTLLSALVAAAREEGVTVLSARGSELERDHPFGIARQLFEPALAALDAGEREQALAGAAALAAPVAWPPAAAPDAAAELTSSDQLYSVLHGLYWLVVNLSEQRPLLLVVDDVHWGDEPSLRWIAYAGHRIEDLAVPLVIGRRTGEAGAHDVILHALRTQPQTRVIVPRPLTLAAADRLMTIVYERDVDPGFVSACHHHAGGNPLVLRELARALREDGVPPEAGSADRVAGVAPDSVARSVLSRLGRLAPAARAVASAAAILDVEATVERAAAVAGIDGAAAIEAADALVRAEIFERAIPIQFRHPLLLTAVRADVPEARRAELHRRAAEVLRATGAPEAEVALHLLAAPAVGADWAARLLVRRGRDARAQGATAAAERLLRRALDEPLEPRERVRVLVDLGLIGGSTGAPDALDHLQQALELAPDPQSAAVALRHSAEALVMRGRPRDAERLCERILATPAAADREVRLVAEAARAAAAFEQRAGRLEPYERLLEFAGLRGETDAERMILFALANYRVTNGLGTAMEAAETAERLLAALPDVEVAESPMQFLYALTILFHAGRFDRCTELLTRLERLARDKGHPLLFAATLTARAARNMVLGHLHEAETDAQVARAAAQEAGAGRALPWVVAPRVLPVVERGEFDQAERLLEEVGAGGELPPVGAFNAILRTRGRLRFLQGRVEEALADFLLMGERIETGLRSALTNPWRSDAAEALVRLGRTDEALEIAREEHERFSRWDPIFGATSLRALGLATGGSEGIALLRRAVEELEPSPLRYDAARALVELGAALRRAKQRSEARPILERGMDLAHQCGGTVVAERARDELEALGARPRRLTVTGYDALTASERRVAEMAAQGLSNPQIAQALFITRKTVEKHLGNVYWKLSINSRDQIAPALAD